LELATEKTSALSSCWGKMGNMKAVDENRQNNLRSIRIGWLPGPGGYGIMGRPFISIWNLSDWWSENKKISKALLQLTRPVTVHFFP
jgi:hypothetical protein